MEGNASVEVEEVEENQHWLQFRSVIEQVRRGKVLKQNIFIVHGT